MSIENWKELFKQEEKKEYYGRLMAFVEEEYKRGECYPPRENIFRAFELTSPESIKAVILGQDPYHEPDQAHGLCFSVLPSQPKLPPSLKNIYKEIKAEYGVLNRENGFLEDIAKQGVLMLNTVLTVRKGEANSHKKQGWEEFTDNVIRYVNAIDRPVVYFLWGKPAGEKKKLLDNPRHLVLETSHPSPLSVRRGFDGCGHFKLCNEFLEKNGEKPINWVADCQKT